ncbi:helix-turn-helix domain-containing protein [Aeromonas veronii]|uniref:helix-turn-helix domain-containing protein n=1 Tax=Aeromonas veronii TaxID=654 RepID=UPI002B47FE61|nr:helix-turn-helix transcriptional regulator [Aeromonas veronii]
MKDFFSDWLQESDENKRLTAQERLIVEVTESLYEKMLDNNIKKSEIADKLNKSQAYVSQLLSGSRNMTLRTLSDIAQALDCVPSVTLKQQNEERWEYCDSVFYPAQRSQVVINHIPVSIYCTDKYQVAAA